MELRAENIAVERAGRILFSGLSFSAARGEALTLTGPNGAGKTTLLRTIAGFLTPAAGKIRLIGGPLEQDLAESCHFVGHANATKAALTVLENARFWAEYLGGDATLVEPSLGRFGLSALAHVPAGMLSAGQKRRLALARLLLAPRPVWLLDEPTVSLDAASTTILAEVVNAHVASGGIVIAATHIPLGLKAARELRLGGAASAFEWVGCGGVGLGGS